LFIAEDFDADARHQRLSLVIVHSMLLILNEVVCTARGARRGGHEKKNGNLDGYLKAGADEIRQSPLFPTALIATSKV